MTEVSVVYRNYKNKGLIRMTGGEVSSLVGLSSRFLVLTGQ